MLPYILIAVVAPITAWFGVLYIRAVNEPHNNENESANDENSH